MHQWLDGNLPVNSKCPVCDKPCGSILRLQGMVKNTSHKLRTTARLEVVVVVGIAPVIV